MMQLYEAKKHYVYVVFLTTNTFMGKMIRFFTRNRYSHVALAFDENLNKMYSFARYHINSPISGGFVVEHPERYLNGGKDVMIKMCKVPVSEKEYHRIKDTIEYFCKHRKMMLYNTLNAVLSLVKKKLNIKDTYTCIEFVTYLLNIRDILAIKELEDMLESYLIYQGSLKVIAKYEPMPEDEYFQRRCFRGVIYDTFSHFGKIILRVAYR